MARLLVRVAVTLLVVGFWMASAWWGNGHTWGFAEIPVDDRPHLAAVRASALAPLPLPPELEAGDVFDRRSLTSRQRLGTFMEFAPPGQDLHLRVQRDGIPRAVTVRSKPWPDYGLRDVGLRSLLMVYTLLGLLLLWRGRDWVAWGLAAYTLGYAMKDLVGTAFLVAPRLPLDASMPAMLALRTLRDLGLFAAVLHLVRPAISPRQAKVWLAAMACVVAIYVTAMLYDYASLVFFARYSAAARLVGDQGMTAGAAVCAAMMVAGYRRSDESTRLRIRWFVVGTVLHALSFLIWSEPLFWFAVALALLAMACFTYAALRHRLVDVSFAVSRTLVYGTVVLVVVGAFAILEHAIAGRAIGKEAGLVLHLVVPLVLGITLHKLRERVEHVIERLFFRRRFEAERALLRLARESAYMEREDRLLARTLHDIARHVRPGRVSIYQRADGGYERVAQEGAPEWPLRIDADDPAFVALRAGAEEQALSAPDGALGRGGIAFPMSVAGRLEGVVVCGDRAQQYTRDERELLRRVAHEVGTALHGLKAQRSERLLEALARGTLSVRDVRERVLRATP